MEKISNPEENISDLTHDEQWWKEKYEPENILPVCPHGNYVGVYRDVIYTCLFCKQSYTEDI